VGRIKTAWGSLASAVAGTALLASTGANAGLLSSFESGLGDWEYLGDVSIQSSAIGLDPTHGSRMVFMSTMCDETNLPVQGGRCETTTNEHPYSGVSSPASTFAREFLGLPVRARDFVAAMPFVDSIQQAVVGESAAMKMRFFAPQAGVLSFDWNKLGSDIWDTAYLSLWSDDASNSTRINDWIYAYPIYTGSYSPSNVDLCSRYYDESPDPLCPNRFNQQTGWYSKSIAVAERGWYWLGIGMGEIAEGTVPTVLAVDNVRYQTPEPGTLGLVCAGMLAIGLVKRRAANRPSPEH
jgi:hypothetical protein